MVLFTLPSSRRLPVYALWLLSVAFLAWVGAAFYSVRLNPETQFLIQMTEVQERWSARLAAEHSHKVVLLGGSSAMFSIIGQQLLTNDDLAVVNLGLNAAVGAQVMTERALNFLCTGDTLILGFEPGLLSGPIEPSAAGIEFAYAKHHPEWAVHPAVKVQPVSILSSLLALRPGAEHSLMLATKLFTKKALYRYRAADAGPDGWNQTAIVRPLAQGNPGPLNLSPAARHYLDSLADWCRSNNVRVAYSLPWRYWSEPNAYLAREENAKFVQQIAMYMPVLKDPLLGSTVQEFLFSDTVWHLNATGAKLRTRELGRQIREWQVWKPEELRNLAKTQHSAPVSNAGDSAGSYAN